MKSLPCIPSELLEPHLAPFKIDPERARKERLRLWACACIAVQHVECGE